MRKTTIFCCLAAVAALLCAGCAASVPSATAQANLVALRHHHPRPSPTPTTPSPTPTTPSPTPTTPSPSPTGTDASTLHTQLGFTVSAADEEFNEPACAIGTCQATLGGNWDAKTEGVFAGWSNIALTGSELDIAAIPQANGTWTGGWLEDLGAHFSPPYFAEVRAQDPAVYGMWPAPGWTWSYPYGTVCGTEIDFGEMLGRWATTVPQTTNGCPSVGYDNHVTIGAPGISAWHTYAAAVYADHVDFYIDGVLTSSTTNAQVAGAGGTVNRTAAVDLTTWLSIGSCGSWADCPAAGTPEQHMYVDWIRAWTP